MRGGVRLTIAGIDAPAARHAWRAGRLLRVTATLRRPLPYRNFGTPDQELRLAWRGTRLFGAVKSAALVEVLARGSPLAEATAAARAWARRTVAAAIGPDDPQGTAIVLAVLIGDRAGLSPDIEARMQRAGTYHVLAISGGNIAVLAAIVLALVGRLGLAPRPRAVVVLGVLALYAAAVVGGASVARATLAAAVYLSARALDLRTPAINAVAVTVALIVAGVAAGRGRRRLLADDARVDCDPVARRAVRAVAAWRDCLPACRGRRPGSPRKRRCSPARRLRPRARSGRSPPTPSARPRWPGSCSTSRRSR